MRAWRIAARKLYAITDASLTIRNEEPLISVTPKIIQLPYSAAAAKVRVMSSCTYSQPVTSMKEEDAEKKRQERSERMKQMAQEKKEKKVLNVGKPHLTA